MFIGSGNGLSPDRHQAIIWTNTGLLLIGPLGRNFSEIKIEMTILFSFRKLHFNMSSVKWRPFCFSLIVLNATSQALNFIDIWIEMWWFFLSRKLIWKCHLSLLCVCELFLQSFAEMEQLLVGMLSRLYFYQTRSAWSMDQGSTRKRSVVHNFAPIVTKFCVMWEGLSLPHDTKFGNCRGEIVDRRMIFIWSLIHGSGWSSLTKAEPGTLPYSLITANLMKIGYP